MELTAHVELDEGIDFARRFVDTRRDRQFLIRYAPEPVPRRESFHRSGQFDVRCPLKHASHPLGVAPPLEGTEEGPGRGVLAVLRAHYRGVVIRWAIAAFVDLTAK